MKLIFDKNIWITAIIENRWVQAKVFNEPSDFGILRGRISKLSVAKNGVHLLGVGTGLAKLEEKSPKIHKLIKNTMFGLEKMYGTLE